MSAAEPPGVGSLAQEEAVLMDILADEDLRQRFLRDGADDSEPMQFEDAERLLASNRPNVVVVLIQGFDELLAGAVIDVLRQAEVHVVVAGISTERSQTSLLVTGMCGICLNCDCNFETTGNANFSRFDAIVVPGLRPSESLRGHSKFFALIKSLAQKQRHVCLTGDAVAFVLRKAGLFQDREMCAPAYHDLTGIGVRVDRPYVLSGNLITCASSAAALDVALLLLDCLVDRQAVSRVAELLHYESPLVSQSATQLATPPAAPPALMQEEAEEGGGSAKKSPLPVPSSNSNSSSSTTVGPLTLEAALQSAAASAASEVD